MFLIDDEQKIPRTARRLKRKCRKGAAKKKKKVKRQLNIDIENVRMGRMSSGESDLNDDGDGGEQDADHVMLEPPPGKFQPG